MNQHLMEGRYSQFVGRIREWIGIIANKELEADFGAHDQFVGRSTERCQVSLEEAERLAGEVAHHA
jgi:uncharacterized protein YjbJ (UPF0337 family)